MSLTVTLIVLAIAVAVFALGSWLSARPADPLNPRLMPWRTIIIIAGLVAIFMLLHLVTMLGIKTDRPY